MSIIDHSMPQLNPNKEMCNSIAPKPAKYEDG